MEIIVINQQRKYKISLADTKAMVEKLSAAVFVNLEKNKPQWIKTKVLTFIQQSTAANLIIVSNQAIRRLNKNWLDKDKETDVLSFPCADLSSLPGHLSTGSEEDMPLLGEIFIAYEKACQQAKEYNHSLERELAFLFVHGMLHILGFDHQDKVSEKDMFDRQTQILKQAGYERKI